jgi:hypothetical protein
MQTLSAVTMILVSLLVSPNSICTVHLTALACRRMSWDRLAVHSRDGVSAEQFLSLTSQNGAPNGAADQMCRDRNHPWYRCDANGSEAVS